MVTSKRLQKLVESGRTVFTPLELRMLWRDKPHNTKIAAVRMANQGFLLRLSRGYYALNKKYNIYELANRIVSPSYVSFQAALTDAGVGFQARGEVGSVALLNYRKKIDGRIYTYVAMKEVLFFNRDGIVDRQGVAMATPERAVLDSFYFGFLPDIDNEEKLNKPLLARLSGLYPRTVQKKVKGLL